MRAAWHSSGGKGVRGSNKTGGTLRNGASKLAQCVRVSQPRRFAKTRALEERLNDIN